MTTDDKMNAMQAATAVLAGIFIGVALTDATNSEFWLYRYQTIIAGILAIIAAAWTVVEMRRSDERQQARHDDLIRLNLRAERLKVRRATFPYTKLFRLLANDIIGCSTALNASKSRDEFRASMFEVNKSVVTCKNLLKDGKVSDAQELFDENLSYGYLTIVRTADRLARRLESAITAMDGHTGDPAVEHETVVEITEELGVLSSELPVLVLQLDELASKYN